MVVLSSLGKEHNDAFIDSLRRDLKQYASVYRRTLETGQGRDRAYECAIGALRSGWAFRDFLRTSVASRRNGVTARQEIQRLVSFQLWRQPWDSWKWPSSAQHEECRTRWMVCHALATPPEEEILSCWGRAKAVGIKDRQVGWESLQETFPGNRGAELFELQRMGRH